MSEITLEAKQALEGVISEKLNAFEQKIKAGFDTSDLKSELTNLSQKYAENESNLGKLVSQMDTLTAKANSDEERIRKGRSFNEVAKELIQSKSVAFDTFKAKDATKFRFEIEDGQRHIIQKAVGSVTLGNVVGDLPTEIGQVVSPLSRKVHVRSLIPNSPMTAATYSYPVFVDGEGTVGIQTEGGAKSQTDVDIEYKELSPIVIAHWQRHSEQVLSDIPWLLSFVSNRMVEQLLNKEDDEILSGAGGSNRLNGILTQATAYAPTGTANTANANRYSYLFNAIAQLAQSDVQANGILVNPYAYYEMLQIVSTDKSYTAPIAGFSVVNDVLRFVGVPVIQSTAMTTNSFLVGDFNEADLRIKNGITVDLSREDADNFTKNLVTIRVEERLGLAVYRPASFITGSFNAIAS